MDNSLFYSLDGPLDPLPASRQVRVANLAGLPELVRRRGGDPRRMLERHAIDPGLIRDPDQFVDAKAVVELFEDCSQTLNDPWFGLDLAELQNPDVFGCVATLCRAAPTVRDAVHSFIEFIPVTHSPDAQLELLESDAGAEIRWQVGGELLPNDQANFKAAMMHLKLLREVAGPGFKPERVQLAVSMRAPDISELARRFDCRFQLSNDFNAIVFPGRVLDRRVRTANRLLYRLLGGYLDRVRAAARGSLAERVEDYLRGALASGSCSIERCAQKLQIPVRTLQSQLAAQGLQFSDLLARQRLALACDYLAQPGLSLDDVAERLGYSEQSSFGRAFKRWTGQSPQGFRRDAAGARRDTADASRDTADTRRGPREAGTG